MPNGNPIKTYNVITYDDQTRWPNGYDDEKKYARQNLIHPYSFETKISLCSSDKKEFSVDLFDDINKIYDLTNMNEHIIKFSGGTNAIKFNDTEHIAIGHIVINVKKMRKVYETVTNNSDINDHPTIIKNKIKENIKQYWGENININNEEIDFIHNNILDIKNREINYNPTDDDADDLNYKGYRLHHFTAIYYMYVYTFNSSTSEITRISNAFVPPTSVDTGVIFPCGIEIKDNNLLISYGETDSLIKISVINMDVFEREEFLKLYNINDVRSYKYKFINFTKNFIPKPKMINENDNDNSKKNNIPINNIDVMNTDRISGGNKYLKKYLKYKQKYLSLKKT